MDKAYRGGIPLVSVERSGFVEGWHHGSVVVLDVSGTVVTAAGDVAGQIFPRSCNKPFQAVGMLRAGLTVTGEDLAVVAASHWGEPQQLARVQALLTSARLTEDDLRCPPEPRLSDPGSAARRLYMNCSGKHTGMLLTCVAQSWTTEDYLRPGHPLQRRLAATIEEYAGESSVAAGTDGCGAPVLSMSLTALAGAYLRLVSPSPAPGADSSGLAVADAMRAYPELGSGVGQDDARLMRAVPGLVAKVGAEGVWAAAVPGVGAVALKIDDGAGRARVPVMIGALGKLGVAVPVSVQASPVLGGGQPVGSLHCLLL